MFPGPWPAHADVRSTHPAGTKLSLRRRRASILVPPTVLFPVTEFHTHLPLVRFSLEHTGVLSPPPDTLSRSDHRTPRV